MVSQEQLKRQQELVKQRLMQLGNNVALERCDFSPLTEDICVALNYTINNIEIKLRQAKRNSFRGFL
ncbi:hypothetical protein SAMN02910357_00061 [Succinivibrio dextrinosolvens]|uniref:hypothetical protein n=1 Tax=Succinivibrio dextrinosolvens TaxID=83771 RepID=UPI0008E2965A|nr:hypothetical protein [Succinivibrio dextrinosolvens]SFS31740.1 hypothetical protein SAMN02910357_00061 [Succinivibrio dextrinosolvens]